RAEGMDLKMARRVERAARSGERLGHLIEVLLDVSGIVTGQLDLVPQVFDLADAVREAVVRLQESAVQVGSDLAFAFDGTLVGSWDRLRIEQMVTNLVSNAIKYGAGAPIRVSLARDEGGAVLEVRDRGPGIPEADLGRIFRRFERAVSVRHHGGFGLGLYVTRQIAEAHGGTVTAGNLPGGGACFTARLPLD